MKHSNGKELIAHNAAMAVVLLVFVLLTAACSITGKTYSATGTNNVIPYSNSENYTTKLSPGGQFQLPPDTAKRNFDSILLSKGLYPSAYTYSYLNSFYKGSYNEDSVYRVLMQINNAGTDLAGVNQNKLDKDYEKIYNVSQNSTKRLYKEAHMAIFNIGKFINTDYKVEYRSNLNFDSLNRECGFINDTLKKVSAMLKRMMSDTIIPSLATNELLTEDLQELNATITGMDTSNTEKLLTDIYIVKVYSNELFGILNAFVYLPKLKGAIPGSGALNYYSSLCSYGDDTLPDFKNLPVLKYNEIMVNVQATYPADSLKVLNFGCYLNEAKYLLKKMDTRFRFPKETNLGYMPLVFGTNYYIWVEDKQKKILSNPERYKITQTGTLTNELKTPLFIITIPL